MTARPSAIRLVLELSLENDEHVAGRIGLATASHDERHLFVGWTELAAAMERLRKEAAVGDTAT